MRKYFAAIYIISDNQMKMYKGEIRADKKPEDSFWGEPKGFAIGIEYFDTKKELNHFFVCNDMEEHTPKKLFRGKKYHSVISVVCEHGMLLFKGSTRTSEKPEDFFKGDRYLNLDIQYFDKKKERDCFFECNDLNAETLMACAGTC